MKAGILSVLSSSIPTIEPSSSVESVRGVKSNTSEILFNVKRNEISSWKNTEENEMYIAKSKKPV